MKGWMDGWMDGSHLVGVVEVLRDEKGGLDEWQHVLREYALPGRPKWGVMRDAVLVGH